MQKVEEYLSCSLVGLEALEQEVVILFSSDERDEDYRVQIRNLGVFSSGNIRVVDADALVGEVIREAVDDGLVVSGLQNNYYVYRLLKSLVGSEFVSFFLEKHSENCPACTPVLEELEAKLLKAGAVGVNLVRNRN